MSIARVPEQSATTSFLPPAVARSTAPPFDRRDGCCVDSVRSVRHAVAHVGGDAVDVAEDEVEVSQAARGVVTSPDDAGERRGGLPCPLTDPRGLRRPP